MANGERTTNNEQEQPYRVVTGGLILAFASLEGSARWVTDALRTGRAYRIERHMGGTWQAALSYDGGMSLGVGL